MEENDDKDWDHVTVKDDREYKVLSYVLPHGEETLRMVISVNHRRTDQAVAHPLTRETVIRSDGICSPWGVTFLLSSRVSMFLTSNFRR